MDLGDRDSHNDWDSIMANFLLKIIFVFSLATTPITLIANNEVKGINYKNYFWPPDMIPHPTAPGDGPTGPNEPDIA